MSERIVITLLVIAAIPVLGLFLFFAIYRLRKASQWYMSLYNLVDARITELIATTKQAADLAGRAAERAARLLRERGEKEDSEQSRRSYTIDQANRIVTEQETPDQRSDPKS